MVWSTFAIIGIVVVLLLLGVCALVNDDNDDPDSYRPVQVASHDYHGDDGCWDGECYDGDGYQQRYDQNYGSRDDRNRNRGRNRGAFSPGPFDRSPVDAFNRICMPGATCYYDGQGDQQPPEGGHR